jgi:hypothetical protein
MYKVIRLYLEPQDIMFSSQEEQDRFHQAIGRMVMYGLPEAGYNDVQAVEMQVAKDKEITGVYHHVVRKTQNWDPKFLGLDESVKQFHQPHPFVMGGIPDKDGIYGFHS